MNFCFRNINREMLLDKLNSNLVGVSFLVANVQVDRRAVANSNGDQLRNPPVLPQCIDIGQHPLEHGRSYCAPVDYLVRHLMQAPLGRIDTFLPGIVP